MPECENVSYLRPEIGSQHRELSLPFQEKSLIYQGLLGHPVRENSGNEESGPMARNMAAMAAKWGMPVSFSSAGLTSASRDEKKGPRTSFEQLNEISLTLQGQQTVQDIVSRATVIFRYLQDVSLVVDEKSKVEDPNNKKRIQETLNILKELFSRLRALYDGSNRRIDLPPGEDLEEVIPLTSSQTKNDMEEVKSSEVTPLQIEHDALQEKLRFKNQQIKEVIDQLRTLIWDVNTVMALKPS